MDKYEKTARVYPCIAGSIIPIILSGIFVFRFFPSGWGLWETFIAKISVFIPITVFYAALGFWCRTIIANTSKLIFQFPLFKQDETMMPTTQLLSWKSEKRKSEQDIKNIAKKVKVDFGIKLLSEKEEEINPDEAKRTIVDAVGKIREVTRDNENLQQYNRLYGFFRNYLGACVYAIVFIIFAIAINYICHLEYGVIMWSGLAFQLALGFISFLILKMIGFEYAKALFNAYITGASYTYKTENS